MENTEKRFIFPTSWKLKKGFEIILFTLILGIFGAGAYFSSPFIAKVTKGSSADLRGGFNNFSGFAPGIWMNGGLKANKESRMYKEFDLLFEANIFDDMGKLNDALKNGDLDFIFTTTDISPISMDKTSDLAKMSVSQFLKIDDSRGADVFIVDESIKTIADLRGKKISCALGWPSNTLLEKTLEAGGLTEQDVIILPMASPGDAKTAFLTKQSDATVVWNPDDAVCLKERASRVLTSTEFMPNIIMDGFVARKEVLEKKHEKFEKLAKAWLTANSEMRIESNMAEAAKAFKVAFKVEDPASDILDGMKKIHFATYGDNLNFFGLSTDFTGITGQMLYNNMARVYKNGYGNKLTDIVSWSDASYPGVIQKVNGLTGDLHAAEGQIKFTPATSTAVTALAIATKRVTVNFETNSFVLTPNEKQNINRSVGKSALELSGYRIRVEGNTDNTGNTELNNTLSKQRAQAVVNYLVNEYNFDRNRFIVLGNGSSKPVADNTSEDGKSANRRTEFEFIQK